VFTWVGQERVSIGEVCRRLQRAGEPRRDGQTTWDRSVVWGMLKNPAYQGTAGFGKTRVGALKHPLRAQRGRALQSRQPYASEEVPREEWIFVPVPAIIEAELYDLVQEQFTENRQRARQGQWGVRYLLQGRWSARCVAMRIMGKRSARVVAKATPARMRIIAVWGQTPIGSGGTGFVRTPRCAPTWWR
jgi:site-specific DNA recombinase